MLLYSALIHMMPHTVGKFVLLLFKNLSKSESTLHHFLPENTEVGKLWCFKAWWSRTAFKAGIRSGSNAVGSQELWCYRVGRNFQALPIFKQGVVGCNSASGSVCACHAAAPGFNPRCTQDRPVEIYFSPFNIGDRASLVAHMTT